MDNGAQSFQPWPDGQFLRGNIFIVFPPFYQIRICRDNYIINACSGKALKILKRFTQRSSDVFFKSLYMMIYRVMLYVHITVIIRL